MANWRRRVRYRLCRLLRHEVVSDQVVMSFIEPDKLLPDGTIEQGDSYEWKTIRCATCGKL